MKQNNSLWIGIVIAAACLAVAPVDRAFGQRQLEIATPKSFLKVDLNNLSLLWQGDQGDEGRGNGEIYIQTWIYWPTLTELENPQQKTFGPLGRDVEFPSGTIVETPPGSGNYSITPATVPATGNAYWNYADCPVATTLLLDVLVWDEDSNTTLVEYVKKIKDAVKEAEDDAGEAGIYVGPVSLIAEIIAVLIDLFTKSSDDPLGRFNGFIDIPDPCAGFFTVDKELDLENLCAAHWAAVSAEDSNGENFRDPPYNITPPANIGKLKLKLHGGLTGGTSSRAFITTKNSSSTTLTGVDLGQPDEAIIIGRLEVTAAVPSEPPPTNYIFALDVDNDLTTGSHDPLFPGAEYQMRLEFDGGPTPVGRLMAYDNANGLFVPAPDGLYDASLNIGRGEIYLTVQLAALGNPEGPIAGWGVVESQGDILSVLPEQPANFGVGITPHYSYSGVPPMVASIEPQLESIDVPRDTPIAIRFNKAMNRPQTQVALFMNPPVAGTFSWQGSLLTFVPNAPLLPQTQYTVVLAPFATDTIGQQLDGNGDMIPGDSFHASFTTEPLPVFAAASDGTRANAFVEGGPIYLATTDVDIPPGALGFVVSHNRSDLVAGVRLIDQTSDGPTPVGGAALGASALGSIAVQGEYNVLIDWTGDGVYDPGIDLIDRTGIGFAVLPDCNGNGIVDSEDIAAGTLADDNADGVPDSCGGCLGDLDGSGAVNVTDLLAVISAWGPCPADCSADIAPPGGDNTVNIIDLLALIGAWGPCR